MVESVRGEKSIICPKFIKEITSDIIEQASKEKQKPEYEEEK
jgi:hypothetical protein